MDFLANYLGNDVLVLQIASDRKSLSLASRITTPETRSPENIALSADGRFIAIANYDGNSVQLFDRHTDALLWSARLANAHGVVFYCDSLVATGLGRSTVVRYGLDGRVRAQEGSVGWGGDQYLWPTGVGTDGQHIFVSDAHTGKIRTLGSDLCEIATVGANGSGIGLFNMPYGITPTESGAWIADTFKQRLLKVDLASGRVISIVEVAKPAIAFGEGYKPDRTATNGAISFLGHTLLPAYGRFRGEITLSLDGAPGVLAAGFYYFTQGVQIGDAIIVGSAQTREWLVVRWDFVCPISIGYSFWIDSAG
ncbi:MAG: beta-propeller fold lactonase family protein [Hyphomicrobiales bacterium]|nr:beta-propeller fold lactonase family protein [Hyphomicrobiales bacterium]